MRIKIKSIPGDFIVEESADPPLSKRGDYAVYILKKKGWNTVDLLLELSRRSGIPFKDFSYGGKKDRHSQSSQYITIKGKGNFEQNKEDYSLEFIGFTRRPMGPDLIRANHFKVTVRALSHKEIEGAIPELELAQQEGYPNYFDDQRFGCFTKEQGFLAEKVLLGHLKGALKIHAAAGENPFSGKRELFAQLKAIPRQELSMHIACFQSFLWNNMLRGVISGLSVRRFKSYPGVTGEYLFFSGLAEEESKYLKSLDIPVPGTQAEFASNEVKTIYLRALEERGLKINFFNKWKLRRAYFKSFLRPAIIRPQEPPVISSSNDEMHPGKQKFTLDFSLPRGSYATMLLKRLFSEDYKV